MLVVETIGLTKDYEVGHIATKTRRALHGLDLAVEEGETFGLIGPNGAGKTTTLKLLMGLVFPTEGEAKILGKPVGERDIKREIGYLPEHPYFYDYLTGRELLSYFGELFGLDKKERRERAEKLLDKVGMTDAADVPLRKYSKGMTQRLGIAQALINRPRVVFFDEPMSGLDPVGRREMTLLVRELKQAGVTVFFCSHILPDVEQLCDRVAILNEGKLVQVGRLSEILDVSVHTVEVVLEGANEELETRLRERARDVHRTGERLNVAFAEPGELDASLELIAGSRVKLVSVTPVKQTLEDHFVKELGKGDAS